MKRTIKHLIQKRRMEVRIGLSGERPASLLALVGEATGECCQDALRVAAAVQENGSNSSVYLLGCRGYGDYVRIGSTKGQVEDRVKDLMVSSPLDYEVIAAMPGGPNLEGRLHDIFAEYAHRGGWFRKSGDLEEFTRLVAGKAFRPQKRRRVA